MWQLIKDFQIPQNWNSGQDLISNPAVWLFYIQMDVEMNLYFIDMRDPESSSMVKEGSL